MAPAAFATIQLTRHPMRWRGGSYPGCSPRCTASNLSATQRAAARPAARLGRVDGSLVRRLPRCGGNLSGGDYLGAVIRAMVGGQTRCRWRKDHAGLGVSAQQFSLDQVLESWDGERPGQRPRFTPPGSPAPHPRPDVMRAAFARPRRRTWRRRLGPASRPPWGLGPPATPGPVPLDHPGARTGLRAACLRRRPRGTINAARRRALSPVAGPRLAA